MLTRTTTPTLYHFVAGKRAEGGHKRLTGDCSGLRGDCSGLRGNCSGLRGDLDDCDLTPEARRAGVNIATLAATVSATAA